jgi:hypothetical protein
MVYCLFSDQSAFGNKVGADITISRSCTYLLHQSLIAVDMEEAL